MVQIGRPLPRRPARSRRTPGRWPASCGVGHVDRRRFFPGTRSRPRPAPSHSRSTSTPAWRHAPGGRWPRPWTAHGSRWLRSRSSGSCTGCPVTGHAQPLEVHALDIDLLFGELAALLAEFDGVEPGADLPHSFHRDLDRQAMAVPARHICIEAGQVARLDDDVLQDLVDRVAQVDAAVGVGPSCSTNSGRLAALSRSCW